MGRVTRRPVVRASSGPRKQRDYTNVRNRAPEMHGTRSPIVNDPGWYKSSAIVGGAGIAGGGIEPSTETLCPIDSYATIDLGAQTGGLDEYSVTGVYRTPNDTSFLRVGTGVWISEVFADTGVIKAKVFNDLNFSVLVTLYISGPGTGESTVVVPLYLNHNTVVGDTLLSDGNDAVLVDATISTINITLPPAADLESKILTIKKVDSSVNLVVIDPDGAETIDGVASQSIRFQWTSITIISDGTEWFII